MRRLLLLAALAVAPIAGAGRSAFLDPAGAGALAPETISYLRRVPAPPNSQFAVALDTFVRRGKSTGWWGDLAFFHLIANAASGNAPINLVGPAFSGGAVHSTAAWQPYLGLNGDASSIWMDPAVAWAQIPNATPNTFFLGEYLASNLAATNNNVGCSSGGTNIGLRGRNGVNAQVFANSASGDLVKVATAVGGLAIYRAGSGGYVVDKGGSELSLTRASSGAWPTLGLGVLRNCTSGATYNGGTVAADFGGAGPGLLNNSAYRQDFHAALDQLMVGIGAVTPDQINPAPEYIGPNSFSQSAVCAAFSGSTCTTSESFILAPSGLRIFQQTPPPQSTDSASTYALFPLTDAATTQIDTLVAGGALSGVNGEAWIWGMRSNAVPNLNANPIFPPIYNSAGQQCRVEYSSYAKADGATLAAIAYSLGQPGHATDGVSGYLDIANAHGFADGDWVGYSTVSGAPDTYCTGTPTNGSYQSRILTDKIVGPNAQLSGASGSLKKGIIIDWEVADGRSGSQATAALLAATSMIEGAGLEAICYLNPLDYGNVPNEGLNRSNLYQIHQACTWLTITAWPFNWQHNVNASIAAQLGLLTGPLGNQAINFGHLMLTVGMGPYGNQLSTPDAAIIREYVLGTSGGSYNGQSFGAFGAINIWRDYGVAGGLLSRQYNQVLATVLGAPTS